MTFGFFDPTLRTNPVRPSALYVLVDDFLPKRSGPGRRPKITDAELISLAVAQVFLHCPSERRFLRLAHGRLGHLFPYIPKQPGYNKRLRALAPQICLAALLVPCDQAQRDLAVGRSERGPPTKPPTQATVGGLKVQMGGRGGGKALRPGGTGSGADATPKFERMAA